jgi:hypothetical protein
MSADERNAPGARTDATGFLAALVDRAAHRAPVLERRRPSVFEPRGPRPPAVIEELEETAETRRGTEIEPRRRPSTAEAGDERAPSVPRAPEAPTSNALERVEEREIVRLAPEREIAASRSSMVEPGRPAREPTEDDPPRPPVARRRARPAPSELPRNSPTAESSALPHEATRPKPVPHAPPPVPRTPVRPTPEPSSARPLRAEPRVKLDDLAERATPRRPAAARQAPIAQPARVAAARALAAPAQPAAAPPPVIVTIGRVEVRAAPEPRPIAAPARRAEPRLSLEDYLRRGGGAR